MSQSNSSAGMGFDSRELMAFYPEIDIHKNNPTLLYCPNMDMIDLTLDTLPQT